MVLCCCLTNFLGRQVMFCPACGVKIADNARFCGSCGAQLGGQTDLTPIDDVTIKSSPSNKKNEVGSVDGVIGQTFKLVTKETDLDKLWLSLLCFTVGNELFTVLLAFMGLLPQEPGVSSSDVALFGLAGAAFGAGFIYFVVKVQAIGKNKPNWILALLILGVLGYVVGISNFIGSANSGYRMPGGLAAVLVIYDQFIGGLITLLLSFRIMKVLKSQ